MPSYTEHYNLIKPNKTENYNIDVANANNDVIDEELHKRVEKIVGKGLSTNDFTNAYKQILDNLKIPTNNNELENGAGYQNAEQVEEKIEDLVPGIIDDKLIATKQFIENSMKTLSEEGTSIHVSDSADYPCELKVEGKSEQTQTEQSANLCPNIDSDKWVLSDGAYKEDGYIVLPQVGAKAEMVVEWNGQTVEDDGLFKCYWGAHMVTEDVENAKYQVEVIYLNEDKEAITSNGSCVLIGGADIWKNWWFSYADTTSYGQAIRDAKYIKYRIIYSSSNTVPYKFKDPMISKTSCATYVEFVPGSPSPDYPSEIENVSGDLLVKATARNILPRTFAEDLLKRLNVSSTDDYLLEIDGKNYFKFQAGLGYQTGKNYFIQDEFEENAQYVFKAMVMKASSETSGAINIGYVYTDGTMRSFNVGTWTNMTEKEVMLTSDAGKTIKRIGVFYNEGTTYINLDKYILCKLEASIDTSKLEYEPYKEQSVTFPLGTQKLMKDGYLGDDGIHNKRKQIVLDGTETIKKGGVISIDIRNEALVWSEDVLSNYFKSPGIIVGNNGNIWIYYRTSGYPEFADYTETELKNWFAEKYNSGNPVIIEYELAEEETTPYTEEQQTAYNKLQKLKTYRTVTNISNNQNTNMKLTYKKDLQTQFQELETMLLESGV